jgi:glycosyltransferase involved in cell wall biosynthesis
MTKTLCLVMDSRDAAWLPGFLADPGCGCTVIAAPTFEGQLAARSLGVPFKAYAEEAWALDIPENFDLARAKAHGWHRLPSIVGEPAVAAVREFKGYPLFSMHESRLRLSFFEIVSAFELSSRILQLEKPARVFFGDRENPFARDPLHMITGSGGLEREALKSILGRVDTGDAALKVRLGGLSRAAAGSGRAATRNPRIPLEARTAAGGVLLFHYGGYYYLDFVDETIAALRRSGRQVVAVNIGEALTDREQAFFDRLGVSCLDKDAWAVADERAIRQDWREKAFSAARAVYRHRELKAFFSARHGGFFEGLAADALCRELFRSEQTVIELLRTEAILEALRPDAVINHFAFHPEETCYVLPFRKAGIPSITMEHGYNWCACASHNTFATDLFAVNGSVFREALIETLGAGPDEVITVGNLRRDPAGQATSAEALKKSIGLDPARPMAVFCDNSVLPTNNEFRHKTARVLDAALTLMEAIPGLQIVYRVHHGGDYRVLQKYVHRFRARGLLFQNSLDIPLMQMASAADVVIAHASSAIAEALLCGTPVVYLCAQAVRDPAFDGWQAIRTVDDYGGLPAAVRAALSAGHTRAQVLKSAQPFFDATLNGNDGQGGRRLAAVVASMADAPAGSYPAGFERWLARLEASAGFRSEGDGLAGKVLAVSGSPAPFVSVVMPAYNRDKLIGETLESFVRQDYPRDRYEIIVADNNSTDATREVVLEWQRRSDVPIVYLFEGRQGVHYARNTAARHSRGEILYYTDDDMVAEPDLVSELVKVFDLDPRIGTATGRVLPRWVVPPPEWVLQLCANGYLSLFDELGEGLRVEDRDFGVYSCHQALRREAFFRAGGFNPESTFTDYIGDGETGLNIKLKDLGYKFGYNGKAVIYHIIPAARMTQDYLNKRLANQGSADCYTEYKKNRYSREDLAKRINRYKSAIIELTAQSVIKRTRGDETWRMDKARTHYYLNRIEYDLRLMEDPAWRELVLRDNWLEDTPAEIGAQAT